MDDADVSRMHFDENLPWPALLVCAEHHGKETELAAFNIDFENVDRSLRVIQLLDDRRPAFRAVETNAISEHDLMEGARVGGTREEAFVERMNFTVRKHPLHVEFERKIAVRASAVYQTVSASLQSIRIADPLSAIVRRSNTLRIGTMEVRFPIGRKIVRMRTCNGVHAVLRLIDRLASLPY